MFILLFFLFILYFILFIGGAGGINGGDDGGDDNVALACLIVFSLIFDDDRDGFILESLLFAD